MARSDREATYCKRLGASGSVALTAIFSRINWTFSEDGLPMVSRKTPYPKRTLAGRPPVCSRKFAACSTKIFPPASLDEIAKATGLIERKRKLTGSLIVTTLAFWKGDTIGYGDLAADLAISEGIGISKQSLQTKLEGAVPFFQALAQRGLNEANLLPLNPNVTIAGVGDVLIADSSTIALRSSLADALPGTGGSGPAASVKIHGIYNLTTQQFARIALTDGKTSDHTEKEVHAAIAKESDLLIRDLGYFDIADLKAHQAAGRFFLTRIPLSLKKVSTQSAETVDIWELLASTMKFSVDTVLRLGDDSFETRVVALRLPKMKAREREAAMRKEKGRPLTGAEKARARWNLFATNLSLEQTSTNALQKLYTWRWQLELIWKAWKSALDIDSVKSASSETVARAYVWARLLCAIALMAARGIIQSVTENEIGILRWYRRTATQLHTVRELIRRGRWCALARLLITLATKHCRGEKRHRTTTLEKVRESAGLRFAGTNTTKR